MMKKIRTAKILERVACIFAIMLLFIIAIGGESPSYADDDTVTVRIELGENHEELAKALAASPQDWLSIEYGYYKWDENDPYKDEWIEVKVNTLELDGTALVITLPHCHDSINDFVWTFGPLLYEGLRQCVRSLGGYGGESWYVDNNELIDCRSGDNRWNMSGSQYSYNVGIGLHQMDYYESREEFKQEVDERGDLQREQTLYILWNKPIESMEFSIDAPQCGEEITTTQGNWYGYDIPDKVPNITCPDDVELYDWSYTGLPSIYWTTSFSMYWSRTPDAFEGVFKGGEKYLAAAYLNCSNRWGYFVSESTDMMVNGEKAEPQSDITVWRNEFVLYKYIEAEHDFDDEWVVEKEPTCSSEGIEARYCTGGCGEKETESIPIDPDAHDWGEWKVIKKATATSPGVKKRVCKHNSSHVETEEISKLGANIILLAKMTSKGKKSMNITWTKVSGASGYDIFFAECNHNGKVYKCEKVKTVKGNKTLKWVKKGLKKKTSYKAYVGAYVIKDGKKTYIGKSPTIHAYTSGGTKKYTNAKKVTVKKSNARLRKGQTFKINAGVKKLKKSKQLISKNHAPKLRYFSSNTDIATVDASGKITAKNAGTCTVYVLAPNGVRKGIKVSVSG